MTTNLVRVDDLDRLVISALQVNGRASWAQVATVVDASESTISRRANRLLASNAVRVIGLVDPLVCGLGSPVLVQVSCTAPSIGAVAAELAYRPDVRFVGLLTGTFDLIVEVIASSRSQLVEVIVDQLSVIPGIERTTTETVLRNFKTTYDWSRDLLPHDLGSLEPPRVDPSGKAIELTTAEMEMIEHLSQDGRLSVAELALRTGASERSTRHRLDSLTRRGALRFATLVDPTLLDRKCEAFVWLDVDLARLEEVAAALAKHTQVRYLSATAGYSDLVAELVLRDNEDLYRFRTEVLAGLPGIRRAETAIELQTVKRGYHAQRPEAPLPSRPLTT